MKDDTISRAAAIDAIDVIPWYHQNKNGEMVHGANSDEHQAWYKAEDIYKAIESVPPVQLAQDLPKGCTDTISRQAAIDALEKVADMFPWRVPGNRDTYDRYNEAWNDAIGRAEMEIENMPSAQPGWIPCSERPPEKSEWYLLTAEWDDGLTTVMKDRYVVGEGWTCAVFGAKCLAWQSLPTPYREGRQDDH